ncbi:MAG: T9SS type A sorting domain-containing protein [Bacteroidales bacterium]|nr:T9SS type A sorting domain-containing protein [Bacteroidales bacterium]
MFFVAVEDRLYRIDGSYFPPVGIEEYDDATGITVHPNPTDDILHVAVTDGNAKIARVEMFDMFGRPVPVETRLIASLPSPQTTVNTSDIPSGLYILRITLTNGTVRNVKVVKE